MDRAGRGLLLVSAVVLLAGCKEKPSSGGAEGVGQPLPSATPSGAPPPVAAPQPSVAPLPPTLTALMGLEDEVEMLARSADAGRAHEHIHMLVKGDKLRHDVI